MKVTIAAEYSAEATTDDIVEGILGARNIDNREEFLAPTHPDKLHLDDFFADKKDFKKRWKVATELLVKAHKEQKTAVVYCDYDADGLTGGAVLWSTLHGMGFKVMPHVPDRKLEGYGFSKVGIDAVKEKYDPDLIISVDHGIVAHDKIEYARSLGIAVIVTDHHQKKETEPPADAVFHTPEVSGSGVAYFFAKKVADDIGPLLELGEDQLEKVKEQFKDEFLSLAAIGIVADMVPLVGAARSVVKYGLEKLGKTGNIGLQQLIRVAGKSGKEISTYEVGFMIAPRINAFGRLTHGIEALRLLCTKSRKQAIELSGKAQQTNVRRQQLVDAALREAREMAGLGGKNGKKGNEEKTDYKLPKLIIVQGENWEEGIIGLIASKLMNELYRPVIVMTRSNNHYKGSARSVEGVDITALLRTHQSMLMELGGHEGAAGFSVSTDLVAAFTKKLLATAQKTILLSQIVPTTHVDAAINLSQANLQLCHALKKLQPFGVGNREPLFLTKATLLDTSKFGSQQQYSKIILRDDYASLELMDFQNLAQAQGIAKNSPITVAYTLAAEEWNGKIALKGFTREIFQ